MEDLRVSSMQEQYSPQRTQRKNTERRTEKSEDEAPSSPLCSNFLFHPRLLCVCILCVLCVLCGEYSLNSVVELELGAVEQGPENVGQRLLLAAGAAAFEVVEELARFLRSRLARQGGEEQRIGTAGVAHY